MSFRLSQSLFTITDDETLRALKLKLNSTTVCLKKLQGINNVEHLCLDKLPGVRNVLFRIGHGGFIIVEAFACLE